MLFTHACYFAPSWRWLSKSIMMIIISGGLIGIGYGSVSHAGFPARKLSARLNRIKIGMLNHRFFNAMDAVEWRLAPYHGVHFVVLVGYRMICRRCGVLVVLAGTMPQRKNVARCSLHQRALHLGVTSHFSILPSSPQQQASLPADDKRQHPAIQSTRPATSRYD